MRKAIYKIEAVIAVDVWEQDDLCDEHNELGFLAEVTGLDYIEISDDVQMITIKETLIWEEAQ